MTYRALSAQALAEHDYDAFLTELQKSLTDGKRDPNEVVRDTLFEIYYGAAQADHEKLSLAARATYHTFDPRNVATEPEYYTDIDQKLYAERKPMIWLWQMFDRSPLGQNSLFGHRFRRMLAPMIFRKVGDNFKCWHFVEWSFGYNLSIGNNVVVHAGLLAPGRFELGFEQLARPLEGQEIGFGPRQALDQERRRDRRAFVRARPFAGNRRRGSDRLGELAHELAPDALGFA